MSEIAKSRCQNYWQRFIRPDSVAFIVIRRPYWIHASIVIVNIHTMYSYNVLNKNSQEHQLILSYCVFIYRNISQLQYPVKWSGVLIGINRKSFGVYQHVHQEFSMHICLFYCLLLIIRSSELLISIILISLNNSFAYGRIPSDSQSHEPTLLFFAYATKTLSTDLILSYFKQDPLFGVFF